MEAALAKIINYRTPASMQVREATHVLTARNATTTPEFPAHQEPAAYEIPTNIGIFITAGVVFLLLFVMCLQDHRKRARMTDAYKGGYSQFS